MNRTTQNPNLVFSGIPRGVPGHKQGTGPGYELDQVPNAKWLPAESILKSFAYQPDRVLLGRLDGHLIGVGDDRHVITVAGSRSGKSVLLACNLIHYAGSVLVIDPKGELAGITARRRADGLKQKVCVLDPFAKTPDWVTPYRARFNPLSILKVDSPTVLEDAGLIADALVVTGANADPHWDESARMFIEGVILHVLTYGGYEGIRDLVTVYDLLSKGKDSGEGKGSMEGLVEEMLHNARILQHDTLAGAIEAAALDFAERPDREQGSVLSTIRRHIRFLGYQSMQTVLRGHDFDLTELKTAAGGLTIYLCLPAGRMGTCNRWLRLFVNLALEAMEREPAKPHPPVLLCLDEFPILGHMKQIEDAAGQIAGFGVKLWPVLQDLNQLKSLYRERWETFMGNAGVLQFFGNADLTTLDYIQKRLGKTALPVQRTTHTAHDMSATRADNVALHDLLTGEEASRLFARDDVLKRQLIIAAGKAPMILQRVSYFDSNDPSFTSFKGKYDDLE
ncbi:MULTISPECIES: type IV secretory system conjugative DNA transfer family protein [unclassified Nitrospina]|uniref:type IV secretory system conjugative DNA transfer family protein n=1 Tax=unclassified Nitrospina TaxID=2638683 RepID=UPI003F97BF30